MPNSKCVELGTNKNPEYSLFFCVYKECKLLYRALSILDYLYFRIKLTLLLHGSELMCTATYVYANYTNLGFYKYVEFDSWYHILYCGSKSYNTYTRVSP